MTNYNNKCATCKFMKPNKGRSGICEKLSRDIDGRHYPYAVDFSRVGCVLYKNAPERSCVCGVYKDAEFNFCPICGRNLRGGIKYVTFD